MLIKFKNNTEKEIANLFDANLRNADLRNADLRDANLRCADLRYAIGNLKQVKSLQLETWHITYTINTIAIGCQQHSIAEWRVFTDDDIKKMDSKAVEWWGKWKEIILKIVEMSPAE